MAPLAAIMVAVPTSNTCSRCGALPARNAAIAAGFDSGYVPLFVGTTLYSFWLALNLLARSLSASPSALCIECHHWISTCAWAGPLNRPAHARATAKYLTFMIPPPGLKPEYSQTASRICDFHFFVAFFDALAGAAGSAP